MILGGEGDGVRPVQDFALRAGQIAHERNAHRGAVAPAAVGLSVVVKDPQGKALAPAADVGVAPTPFLQLVLGMYAGEQRIGHGNRAAGVVGVAGLSGWNKGVKSLRRKFLNS